MVGCQFLFHVAAHYRFGKWTGLLYRHNVLGTRNVLAAARQAERTVYTSSVAAIGVGSDWHGR